MAGNEEITRKGRIVSITPEVMTVEVLCESACSACHAKAICSMSETERRLVEVRTSGWDPHEVGDEVEVVLRKAMGYKAVFIAYGLPLVVLVFTLMLLTSLGVGELYSGLGAIAAVVLCYLVIFLFRNKLHKEYAFYIK